jgi:hypothetical protein
MMREAEVFGRRLLVERTDSGAVDTSAWRAP